MKKTLLVTTDFPPAVGGVATYWNQVCSSLDSDKLVVLTNNQEASHKNITVEKKRLLFRLLWPKWLKGVYQVYAIYKQHACEQILVGQVLPVGSMVYVLHKLFGIKYVVQVYGMDLLQAKTHPRKKRLAKKVLQNAERVIVNSKTVGRLLEEFCVNDYTVVYPVPDALPDMSNNARDVLQKTYNLKDKKVILTLGRLVKRKGVDKTLGAMQHVWQRFPNAVYVIAGDGEERAALEKMAEPHKDNVLFLGRITEQERNLWLSTCDLFIMPSRQTASDVEGFGMVYLEAHHYAKPVIAGNTGGAIEAVEDGVTGLLVDPNDIDSISEGLIHLLSHPELATKLGVQGKKRLAGEFSWKEQVETLKQAL